ncbi:MAG: cob(I)yrinic acid a,c-diamide adenosyltransferase [Armatimonadetes bacterium]|nr:MAG: cob(I)yrinic acid a,c-diamide adenosyltransferase [Armatimonadota bacterium]
MEKGLVIIYTGEGKGKTTAALGLVLRAAGYKRKVLIVQFGKASFSGEIESLKKFAPAVKIIQGGKGFVGILGDNISLDQHRQAAEETYRLLYQEVVGGKWDIVVADEIIGAIAGKLLALADIIKLVQDKPEKLNLVLTGRHAPLELIKLADLVTEMKPIKHPFEKGIVAREGIDY